MLPEDLLADYQRGVTSSAVIPHSGSVILKVTGPDRATVLHNLCTQDIKSLTPGTGKEVFFTSLQGRVLGFGGVICRPDALWVIDPTDDSQKLIQHCQRYVVTEEADFHDVSPDWQLYTLVGPSIPEQFPEFVTLASAWHSREFNGDGLSVIALGGPWQHPINYRCLVARESVSAFLEWVSQRGVQLALPDVAELFRVEAGWPRFGIDITPDNFPQELDRDALAISFRKGCYLGQETVARIDALGHVNRVFRAWYSSAVQPPPPGTEVQTLDGQKSVGLVTSSIYSPRWSGSLSLGYLRCGYASHGTELRCGGEVVRVLHAGADDSSTAGQGQ